MAIIDKRDSFQIGRVVSRTFDAIGGNAVTFFLLAVPLKFPVLLLALFYPQIQTGATPGSAGQVFGPIFAAFIAAIISTFVLQAALVQGAVSWLNGERATFGECLKAGFRYFLSLLAIMVLFYLGMMLGAILLVVPGIMLALGWSVVVPVRVMEQLGIGETFGRSRELTDGHRWKILGLVLIYTIAAALIQFALAPVFGISLLAINSARSVPFQLVRWVIEVALSVIAAAGIASLYIELRLVKEGAVPSQLVSAFD